MVAVPVQGVGGLARQPLGPAAGGDRAVHLRRRGLYRSPHVRRGATDSTTLQDVLGELGVRFAIGRLCVVAPGA